MTRKVQEGVAPLEREIPTYPHRGGVDEDVDAQGSKESGAWSGLHREFYYYILFNKERFLGIETVPCLGKQYPFPQWKLWEC